MKNNWKAHIALLLTNLFFGANYSAVQYIIKQGVKPFALNVLRVAAGTILFWLLLLILPQNPSIQRKHFFRLLLCSLTGIVINQLLFIKGLSMTYSIHAALLILVTPIFITFAAAWLVKEPLGIYKLSGLVLGIMGAVMLVLLKDSSGKANNVILGNLFVILNAVSYAFYFVLVKPLMQVYHPVNIIRWVFTIGLIFILPIGWDEFRDIPWQKLQLKDFEVIGLIVFTATFLAYLFNLYGISRIGASVAGAYIYTQPVFATLIAVFIVKSETLSLYKLIAAALIMGGVLLVNKKTSNS